MKPLAVLIAEDAHAAEFAVVSRVDAHPAIPHAPHPFGDQGFAAALDLLGLDRSQDVQLWAQRGEQSVVDPPNPLAVGADTDGGADDLRQRDQVLEAAWRSLNGLISGTIGKRLHPVQHPDDELAAALGTEALGGDRLRRLPADAALAVAVEVVFAFLRIELDRPRETAGVALPQGGQHGWVRQLGVETGGLATQLAGRVGVGAGDEGVAVECREPAVHRRIGG